MFIRPDKMPERLEKGKISNPPAALNRSGNKRGIHPNSDNLKDVEKEGRGDSSNIPPEVRATIGALARVSGIVNTAEAMGVNTKVVQFAKFGKTTGNEAKNEELEKKIDDILAPVRNKAIERLTKSLSCLTDDKLNACKGGELSKVASNLSSILRNIQLPESGQNQATQVIIYAPEQKPESHYDEIQINAQ